MPLNRIRNVLQNLIERYEVKCSEPLGLAYIGNHSVNTHHATMVLDHGSETITLGTLTQDVLHPVTGYVAFFTVVLFLIAVFLLPHRGEPRPVATGMEMMGHAAAVRGQRTDRDAAR